MNVKKTNAKIIISLMLSAIMLLGLAVPALADVNPKGIKLLNDSGDFTLKEGKALQLKVEILPGDADQLVVYSSSNKSIADVDENGLITSNKTGSAIITATTSNKLTAKCTIKVIKEVLPAALSVEKNSIVMDVGDSKKLDVKVSPDNSTDKLLKYKSSKTSVVTVNADGNMVAKKKGDAKITVTTINGISISCSVKVVAKGTPVSMELNHADLTLAIMQSAQLIPQYPEGTANTKTTYSSSDKSVAVVDKYGYITGKGQGSATITIKADNGISKSVPVTVTSELMNGVLGDTAPEVTVNDISNIKKEVIRLVNAERKKAGLSALSTHSSLQKAADIRAEEIVKKMSHTRPDGSKWSTAITAQGIKYSVVAENIAAGQATAEQVVNSWMGSEGHRANILNKSVKYIAVGYCYEPNSAYMHFWSQLFLG